MPKTKLKSHLHRGTIILICLALMALLMQGASYFSLNYQLARSKQIEELAQTLTKQVAHNLAPFMRDERSIDNQSIENTINLLTSHNQILNASVYLADGRLLSHAGEQIDAYDRLSIDGRHIGNYFTYQFVEPIQEKNGLFGFIRVTLDTRVEVAESMQVDNTTDLLRLMLFLTFFIGVILTRTLLPITRRSPH